jgi:hypothetical protein
MGSRTEAFAGLGAVVLGCSLVGLATHVTVAMACGGGVPVAPSGTSLDELPFTEAFQIMVAWEDDLDGAALVSVGANIHNAPDGFGYVVPIPQVIDSSALSVGSGDLLDGLETYTGPRSLRQGCGDYRPHSTYVCPKPADRGGGGGGEGEGEGEGGYAESGEGLDVETTQVGDYEVSLLSSDGATGLLTWLEDNDFELPVGSDVHIDQYLEQGFMFAAVRVPAGTEVADGSSLPPLNFHLSEGFRTLPLLLAANAAQGTQDVILTTWAPNIGAVGISNLAEVQLEDDCMARDDDMSKAYGDSVAAAHAAAGEAVWMLEFYKHNSEYQQYGEVTSAVGMSDAQHRAIEQNIGPSYDLHRLGRVHIRYDPGELTVDPAFYAHAAPDFDAIEYIEFRTGLTEFVPVCGEGMADDGVCPPTVEDDRYCTDDADASESKDGGCSSAGGGGGAAWFALPFAIMLGVRRQRQARSQG